MKTPRPLPIASIDEIAAMAPELNAWTEMAARAYGTYAGINDAIKKARAADGSVAHHASEIRQQMIMMALIRSFAVMDRDARVSFQTVYRFLGTPNALNELARCYANSEPPSSLDGALTTCADAKTKFLEVYRAINFTSLSRMQSFRNSGIAHISMPDVEKARVTYTEIEQLVLSCCDLAGQLTLMVSGGNDWPKSILMTPLTSPMLFGLRRSQPTQRGALSFNSRRGQPCSLSRSNAGEIDGPIGVGKGGSALAPPSSTTPIS